MSNYIIIDTQTGTVIPIAEATLVKVENLDELELETISDGGSDSEITNIGKNKGLPLANLLARCGWGDLNYGNCIAYSPFAIKDELHSRLEVFKEVAEESDSEDDAETADGIVHLIEWALRLSNDQLSQVSEIILQSDEAWHDYMVNIIDALSHYYNLIHSTDEVVNTVTETSDE